ncbi:uncharacterized protein J7T54_001529 [Emericellopsis cladophorae]|uniref:Non-structural maintenance of chromosomes element 4 n=1 Tax=Emericellopsis cladophorae TaxID=2686198 RepID=A0A9P9XVF0_9HYPO|nr:uncharacterized protein J7T54_001529 [Emericellopsis cladophorae]KAI6778109.1 hypothetical protein J7T54_001529 [Emericellopsis cladophorae]
MPTCVGRTNSYDRSSPEDSAPDSAQATLAVRERRNTRDASVSKRKRADTTTGGGSNQRQRTTEPRAEDDGEDGEDEERNDSDGGSDIYDPDQPLEERREVQRGFRNLLKDITENSEEYLQTNSTGLRDTIARADEYLKKVRRPGEAASDSRLLVSTTDLSYRRTLRLAQGSSAQGLDVDEFVSKCIIYMRQGGGIVDDDAAELSSTQRHRRQSRGQRATGGEEDEDEDGDMMNWPHLGRFAVQPHIRRPALPGFLLGPLSLEKKVRKITKRSAPFRPGNLEETRPEVLNVSDFETRENDLTALCGKILQRLQTVQQAKQEILQELITDDISEDEAERLMHEQGLRNTGGVDLMRFVTNPRSFGQTVENMFYVSFLIRDGRAQIEYDKHGIPALSIVWKDEEAEPRSRSNAAKHQAILSMDMATWQEIVQTLEIEEPMIEHRVETHQRGPGARGWYS